MNELGRRTMDRHFIKHIATTTLCRAGRMEEEETNRTSKVLEIRFTMLGAKPV